MSESTEERVESIERRIASIETEVRSCVRELLVRDDARYLIMERLPRLGSAVIEPVHELLQEGGLDAEGCAMAALVALEVGDRSVAPVLLAEVTQRGRLAPLAGHRLVAHEIDGAGEALLQAVRSVAPQDIDETVAYLDALRKLGWSLPIDERQRLLAGGAWQIATAIEEWFPTP